MKAYFVDNDLETLYELSESKRKKLELKHPNWIDYDCEDNYDELNYVVEFFKSNGKLIASPKNKNIFVGLTI